MYEDNRDLISLGAYKKGSDPAIDEAIAKREPLSRFLVQRQDERESLETTLERAHKVIA